MTASDKVSLRRELLAARHALSDLERAERDEMLCDILLSSPLLSSPRCVLLYAAVRGEIDLARLATALEARGIPTAYPITERGGVMHFHVCRRAELTPGRYDIPEPPHDAPLAPLGDGTLCLVPGLAYDADGYRIGYGGGYYDRFLAHFPGISIGICEKPVDFPLPRDTYDRKVDYLLTVDSLLPIL